MKLKSRYPLINFGSILAARYSAATAARITGGFSMVFFTGFLGELRIKNRFFLLNFPFFGGWLEREKITHVARRSSQGGVKLFRLVLFPLLAENFESDQEKG